MSVWRVSDGHPHPLGATRLIPLPWEREGAAQPRKGEDVKAYGTAPTGASLRARQLRRGSPEVERQLVRALREKLPACKWRHQMPVGPYIVDIACFAERLIIELDGGQHAEAAQYDAARTKYVEAEGYRVLRFWNNDVVENIEGVIAAIAEALSSSPSRRCAPPSLSQGRGVSGEAARG